MYIRTQRALAVGVSVTHCAGLTAVDAGAERDLYGMHMIRTKQICSGKSNGLGKSWLDGV